MDESYERKKGTKREIKNFFSNPFVQKAVRRKRRPKSFPRWKDWKKNLSGK